MNSWNAPRIALSLLMLAVWASSSAAGDDGVASSRSGKRKFLTLAYYYPWYTRGDWSRHGYVGTPKLGKYGTDDAKIAEQHIRWAARRHRGAGRLLVGP